MSVILFRRKCLRYVIMSKLCCRNRHVHRERIFRCDTCLKAFTSYDIYLAHLRTREHELREHFQMMSSSTLQLECLGCMQTFDSIYTLNRHTRSCRIVRTLQTKFRCIPCEAYISDVAALKAHIKSHEGSAIITCPVCGERGFPGFNQLNHHITRAHALKVSRRFVCRYCESAFGKFRCSFFNHPHVPLVNDALVGAYAMHG